MLTNNLITRTFVISVRKKSLYPSVLLQRIQWTSGKHPQWVIGQNDEHVDSFSVLWGPCDWEDGVCASARQLGQTTMNGEIFLQWQCEQSPNCSQKQLCCFLIPASSCRQFLTSVCWIKCEQFSCKVLNIWHSMLDYQTLISIVN